MGSILTSMYGLQNKCTPSPQHWGECFHVPSARHTDQSPLPVIPSGCKTLLSWLATDKASDHVILIPRARGGSAFRLFSMR